MAYYSDFSIDKMENFILPLDFFKDIKIDETKLNELKSRKKDLKKLGEEITKKQQKELKSIKNEIKDLKNCSSSIYTNKYGFQCVHCEYKDIEKLSLENEEQVFFLCNNTVYTLAEEGDYTVFKKQKDGYVLSDLGYTKSNFGWIEDKMISLIQKLKLTVTVLDEGDEETGFSCEDGMEREPVNKVYIKGELQ